LAIFARLVSFLLSLLFDPTYVSLDTPPESTD
jgi:hypothetical protein